VNSDTTAIDQRVYQRGGLALRTRIGDERFVMLLREWAARHRHGSVATDQFVALASGSGPRT
jgi:aminopeptidase